MSRFDGEGYSGKYEDEFPQWAHQLAIPYHAYDLVAREASRKLGTQVAPGEIHGKYQTLKKLSFYQCIEVIKEDLPDVIECQRGSARQLNFGGLGLSANPYSIYFLPQTDEVLVIDAQSLHHMKDTSGLFPSDPGFMGLDALRETNPIPVSFYKLTHVPNQAWGELEEYDMGAVMGVAEVVLRNSQRAEAVKQHLETVGALEKNLQAELDLTKEEFGGKIRPRINQLVDGIAAVPHLYRSLPKRIEAGVRWERRPGTPYLDRSLRQPLYLLDERRLVLAEIKTRRFLGIVIEQPDIKNSIEAGNQEWINTESLVANLMRPIDDETRGYIENPAHYERIRAIMEGYKADTPGA